MIRLILLLLFFNASLIFAGQSPFWNVHIFMAADNDLEEYALKDLEEMRKVLPKNANVRINLDIKSTDGIFRFNLKNFYNNIVFHKAFEENYFNSQAEMLNDFLTGVKDTPNDIIIIWGHGEGFSNRNLAGVFNQLGDIEPLFFLPSNTKSPRMSSQYGGVAFDDSNHDFLDTLEIKDILKRHFKKIEILIFDACLMQNLETLTELDGVAEYLIGSTQVQDYVGLPYDELMSALKLDTYQLAKEVPEIVNRFYNDENAEQEKAKIHTLSSINTNELENVFLPQFEKSLKHLNGLLEENPFLMIDLTMKLHSLPRFQGNTRELGIFIGALKLMIFELKDSPVFSREFKQLDNELSESFDYLHQSMVGYTFGSLYYDIQPLADSNYLLGYFKGLSFWQPVDKLSYDQRKSEFNHSVLYKKHLNELSRLYKKLFSFAL